MLRAVFALSLAIATTCAIAAESASDGLRYFRIATGSAVGTYFPIGTALVSAISNPPGSRPCERGGSCGVPGLVAVAHTSEGALANVAAVDSQVVDSALAQADIVHGAYTGQGAYFRGARHENLRVIANLYPETIHLVARRGAEIRHVRDLIGKRVSIDKPGSGTRLNAELILAAYGIDLSQLDVIEIDPGDAFDLFQQGSLDAFFLIAGYPAAAVSDLTDRGLATLVPIGGRPADAAVRRHRFFALDAIPVGTYAGVDDHILTLSVGAQWIVNKNAEEALIYQITKALWHPRNRQFLVTGHGAGQRINLNNALSGVAIPLHPGAERYYREIGLIGAEGL
jgi:TRAP transporter TAXI family solute receptor